MAGILLPVLLIKIENNIYFNNFKIINMENEVKQKCTNCKCYRISSEFIGKSGGIVKRCLKCREKDAKQKKRPDVIEKRNKRQSHFSCNTSKRCCATLRA